MMVETDTKAKGRKPMGRIKRKVNRRNTIEGKTSIEMGLIFTMREKEIKEEERREPRGAQKGKVRKRSQKFIPAARR